MLLPSDELKSLLLQAKVVDEAGLEDLITYARNSGSTLEEAIIEKDILTDETLGKLFADYLKFPFINLKQISISETVIRIVPERIARKFHVISFERDQNG